MSMLYENFDILKLWNDLQMFKYKTIQILVIFLTMTGCDTPSPRDADASKNGLYVITF